MPEFYLGHTLLKYSKLALSFVWGIAPATGLAQQAQQTGVTYQSESGVSQLKEVTVTSTRTERPTDKVPNSVSVIPASTLIEEGARDIKDAFRDEVDVTVRAAPARFTAARTPTGRAGNEGINIRGLEGNQVLILVDGIRVPGSFSFGAFSTGRGDYLELGGLKAVEVLRGPASTQYGSDGLAGAVLLRTLDPSDLLKPDGNYNGFARSSYASVDGSWTSTLGAAGSSGQWQGMLLGNDRRGNAVANKGGNNEPNINRTTPNPVDYENRNLLGKATLTIDHCQQAGLTFETQNGVKTTEVYSARAVEPLIASSTLNLNAQDQIRRDRVSVEHHFSDLNASHVQRAETRLYVQNASVKQFAAEDRNTAPDRTRDNTYTTNVVGVTSLLETNLGGPISQRLTYGVDWSSADVSAVRSGTVPPYGETFPVKPFPDTTYTMVGGYVQSEAEVGKVSVIAGLRLDQYSLTPSTDGYQGGRAVSMTGQALTPRLGAIWQLSPAFSPYAQISQGYRAPSPEQVNNGFSNIASGYTSIGNANLRAENANSAEIGLRGRVEKVRYSVSVFDNRYSDFISQQVVSGSRTPSDPAVYQYVNLAKASIQGLEMRAEWQMDARWKASAGLASSKGTSEINAVQVPLDTIQPLKAILAARYDEATWGARSTLTLSDGKNAAGISTGIAQFSPPAYAVLDLGIFWKLRPNLTLNATLNNALDVKYWRWSDVSGLASDSNATDAYTAPGINGQASLQYDF